MSESMKTLEMVKGIATLCGSTRFFDQYREAARQLCHRGWMTFECGAYGHSYHKNSPTPLTHQQHVAVKRLHFKKLALSQLAVVCTDGTGYIGDSTRCELLYCTYRSIPVVKFDGVFSACDPQDDRPFSLVRVSQPTVWQLPQDFDNQLDTFFTIANDLGVPSGIMAEKDYTVHA